MKIRSGFVSNSSSSSYVVVGYEDLIDVSSAMKKLGLENEGFYSDDSIFGVQLARVSDSGDAGEIVNKDEVFEAFETMQELAAELGIKEEPQLFLVIGAG